MCGDMSLHFVIHNARQMREQMALAERSIARHPAGSTAITILRNKNHTEKSAFLGLAIDRKKKWLGLHTEDNILGLFHINTDMYETPRDAQLHIHHLTWHALDLYDIRRQPKYRRKFREGPMIPKRSALNLSRANIQADAFAAILQGLEKEDDAVEYLARIRAMQTLSPQSDFRAEEYPFAIAQEPAAFILAELKKQPPATQEESFTAAHHMAVNIGKAFDADSIRQWWNFSKPAQDMAWRGLSPEEILSAAIHTSEDHFTRATGYLIADITGIEPSAADELENTYNAFAETKQNKDLHEKLIDTAFEEAITRGIEEKSARPLMIAANTQNEELAKGRILGWCAHALQAAAGAFEKAHREGYAPAQAARLEFEGNRDTAGNLWDTLKQLGDSITERRRLGYTVTVSGLKEICSANPVYAPILNAVTVTMNDPAYLRKLEAANSLNLRPELPPPLPAFTPAPQMPAPAPAFAPPVPGLGGITTGTIRRQQEQTETE